MKLDIEHFVPFPRHLQQQSRKTRDAATVVFGLKFANDIHYKFKSSQASKAIFRTPNTYSR